MNRETHCGMVNSFWRALGRRTACLTATLLLSLAAGAATQPYDEALEYVESDGSQYMDTGLVLSNDVTVTLSFAAVKPFAAMTKVFGGRDAYNSRSIACFYDRTDLYADFNNGDCESHRASCPSGADPTCRWDVEISARRRALIPLSATLVQKENLRECPDEFSTSGTARIFDLSGSDSGTANWLKGSIKLYSLTITNSTGVLRDYQPCRKNGVVGLYDRATGEFLAPATGVLAAGPTVVTPASDVIYADEEPIVRIVPTACPVEYIESDGIAYLDTGLVLSDTMSVTVDYNVLDNVSPTGIAIGFFGARSSASSRNIAISASSGSLTASLDFSNSGSYESYRLYAHYELEARYSFYLGADKRRATNVETGTVAAGGGVWTGEFTTPSSALVFWVNGTSWDKMRGRVYSLVITDGSDVIRDYEPYVTNGVACLRDRKTGAFLFNANPSGGVLTAGPALDDSSLSERITGGRTNAVGRIEVSRLGADASSCDIFSVVAPRMATAVEYLESDGAQSFELGFPIAKDMTVTLEFMVRDFSNGPAGVFGSRVDASTRTAAVSYASDGQVSCDFGGTANHRANATCQKDVKYTVVLGAKERSLKGGAVDVKSPTDASGEDDWQTPGNALIFGTQNTTWKNAKARLYSLRIERGGKMFRDFRPCVRDGVPCLFDRVTMTYLFEAAGRNGFLVGPKIESPDGCYHVDELCKGPVVPLTNFIATVTEPTSTAFSIPFLQPGTSYDCYVLADNHVTAVPSRMPASERGFFTFATTAEDASLAVDYLPTSRARLALTVSRSGTGATKLHALYGAVCGGDSAASWEHDEVIADLASGQGSVSVSSPRFEGGVNYLRLWTEDGEWSRTIFVPCTGLVQKPQGGMMLIFR